jgi:hypothetical protein
LVSQGLPQHCSAELHPTGDWSPQLEPEQMQVVVSHPKPSAVQRLQSQAPASGGPASGGEARPVQWPLAST